MQQKSPGLIRRLLCGVWNALTFTRVLVFNLLFLALLIIIISSFESSEPLLIPEKAALRVAPSGILVDKKSYSDPLSQLFGNDQKEAETEVPALVKTIKAATNDPRITHLLLDLNDLQGGGISKLEEVGQALSSFKASGKPIIAVSDHYAQDQYFLASFADDIYIHPMGGVLLTGYGSYRNYFKSALDKLAVKFHVFRVGEYKDFIEPYTRDDMSEASREHNTQWLNELWSVYSSHVENLRNLPKGAVDDYINNLDDNLKENNGDGAKLAQRTGLVDHIKGRVGLLNDLKEKIGENTESQSYLSIDYEDYLSHSLRNEKQHPHKVGLIIAQGAIIDGEQPTGVNAIGGDTLAEMLQIAREDDNIKALVLRIDSGGGSAFASEVIREELKATREAGKPVIISMGSVAASGGYWITTAADEVWATPTTITGSIGVFGLFPTMEKSLEKLGIHSDGVGTTRLSGAFQVDRELSPLAQNTIQQGVEGVYDRFINLVAESRGSSPEEIHSIAQGRVWTGSVAKEIGLVDHLGYLDDAIASAARHVKLEAYNLQLIEKPLSAEERIFREIFSGSVNGHQPMGTLISYLPTPWREFILPLTEPFSQLLGLKDPRNVYAKCVSCIAP